MGNNSKVDEAKNQINDLEHKEAKTTNQNKKKIESQKMKIVKAACGTILSIPTFTS